MSHFIYYYAECRHAECRHSECRHAECRHAECYAKCPYAECCYAKCRYAECRGALLDHAMICSTVVEHLPRNYKIKASNPTSDTGRDRKWQKSFIKLSISFQLNIFFCIERRCQTDTTNPNLQSIQQTDFFNSLSPFPPLSTKTDALRCSYNLICK